MGDDHMGDKRMGDDQITRRDFIKRAVALGLTAYGLGEVAGVPGGGPSAADAAPGSVIAVASKQSPAALVRAAVGGLGGIKKFVKQGATVLVKPNIAWARRAEQAATTNPEVVAEVVRLCLGAGARQVKVIDHAVDRPDAVLLNVTGIGEAAKAAGAAVSMASSPVLYQRVALKRGKVLRSVDVLRDLMRADVFINVPIAKVHSGTGLTLGLKNLMGTVWDRGAWHGSASLDQAIADYAGRIKPHLIILDAYRILLTNGPKGPGRTEERRIVAAGTDPLAVDAYGATLFGKKAEQVSHLARAHKMGVGEIDLGRVKVKNV